MQRTYNFTTDSGYQIMVDFGDKIGDYATEVISKVSGNKVEVLSTRVIGKSSRWSKEDVNLYLTEMICTDKEDRE